LDTQQQPEEAPYTVQTAPHPSRRNLSDHLYCSLAAHLHAAGVTITHAPIQRDDVDATWSAHTATLTLRPDAEVEDHIAVLSDLARMITLRDPSWRGAFPVDRPRHLHALAD
jgi:hypothetical protein